MSEPLIRLLAELPSGQPDAARAERIRMRCRTRLARQASSASASRTRLQRLRTAQVWQPVIAVLGVAYITEVLILALRLWRVP